MEVQKKKNSDLATASMIFGIGGIVLACSCCLGFLGSSLALILGLISRTEYEFDPHAKIGVITGAVGLALSVVFLVIWIIVFAAL